MKFRSSGIRYSGGNKKRKACYYEVSEVRVKLGVTSGYARPPNVGITRSWGHSGGILRV